MKASLQKPVALILAMILCVQLLPLSGVAAPSAQGPPQAASGTVDARHFSFSRMTANEAVEQEHFDSYEDLARAYPSAAGWTHLEGGDLYGEDGKTIREGLFPEIPGCRVSSVRIHDTRIAQLGSTSAEGTDYITFCAVSGGEVMSSIAIPEAEYRNAPIEVRYVPAEQPISYEVFLRGRGAGWRPRIRGIPASAWMPSSAAAGPWRPRTAPSASTSPSPRGTSGESIWGTPPPPGPLPPPGPMRSSPRRGATAPIPWAWIPSTSSLTTTPWGQTPLR